jgi:hypothetical protein
VVRRVYTRRGATCDVTKDVGTFHGVAGGCTAGSGAKSEGTLRADTRTDNGGKPDGTIGTGRGTGMGGTAITDVPISKMSKSLVRRGEAEKEKSASSYTRCRETMIVARSRHQ